MITMGKAMQSARLDAGMDVLELSVLSGVPESTIRHYESNYPMFKQLWNLIALVDALGLTIDEYIGHRVKDRSEDE